MQAVSEEILRQLVETHIPDAQVSVTLYAGDDHFEMCVVSPAFAGKSRIKQHRMVYAALGEHMRDRVHALSLKTYSPESWKMLTDKDKT